MFVAATAGLAVAIEAGGVDPPNSTCARDPRSVCVGASDGPGTFAWLDDLFVWLDALGEPKALIDGKAAGIVADTFATEDVNRVCGDSGLVRYTPNVWSPTIAAGFLLGSKPGSREIGTSIEPEPSAATCGNWADPASSCAVSSTRTFVGDDGALPRLSARMWTVAIGYRRSQCAASVTVGAENETDAPSGRPADPLKDWMRRAPASL
jgi:hypothetical protein